MNRGSLLSLTEQKEKGISFWQGKCGWMIKNDIDILYNTLLV